MTAKAKCPICRKATAQEFRPFCSARCRDVDLNRWLTGSYVIPGARPEETEESPAASKEDEPG